MSELRNIRWGKFGRDLLSRESLKILGRSKSLQWALTYALRQQGMMVIDDLDELILEYQVIKFKPDVLNYPRMFEAPDRYVLSRIRPTDVVLDLGANIGSFTLQAGRVAKVVIAYEPIFGDLLAENIELNSLVEKIYLERLAIGEESGDIIVDCQEYKKEVPSVSFYSALRSIEKVDFLRMDIGGQEWNIKPEELSGIRNLEIEFHFWKEWQRVISNWPLWKRWLESEGYGYRARWSKHGHWLYLSASKDVKEREEVHLTNGSFRGKVRQLWRGPEKGL